MTQMNRFVTPEEVGGMLYDQRGARRPGAWCAALPEAPGLLVVTRSTRGRSPTDILS